MRSENCHLIKSIELKFKYQKKRMLTILKIKLFFKQKKNNNLRKIFLILFPYDDILRKSCTRK